MSELVISSGYSDADFAGPNFVNVKPDWDKLNRRVEQIESVVFGQPEASYAVASATLRVEAGIHSPNRPEFVGIFIGQPGSGKTEMGRATAQAYWGDDWESHYRRISCSDFQSPHEITRITGSTPGYRSFGDPNAILFDEEFLGTRNVIVFDEIEKAHRQLPRVLLDVLDHARLTVAIGTPTDDGGVKDVRKVPLNFTHSSIIFTANIGNEQITKARAGEGRLGFTTTQERETDVKGVGLRALREHFADIPEFLDRIPSQNRIVFEALTPDVMRRIFSKFLAELDPALTVTEELTDWVIGRLKPNEGARHLQGTMERDLMNTLALVRIGLPLGVPVVAGLSKEDGGMNPYFKVNAAFLHSQAHRSDNDGTRQTAVIPDSTSRSLLVVPTGVDDIPPAFLMS